MKENRNYKAKNEQGRNEWVAAQLLQNGQSCEKKRDGETLGVDGCGWLDSEKTKIFTPVCELADGAPGNPKRDPVPAADLV
jgi:hypothetical protein